VYFGAPENFLGKGQSRLTVHPVLLPRRIHIALLMVVIRLYGSECVGVRAGQGISPLTPAKQFFGELIKFFGHQPAANNEK